MEVVVAFGERVVRGCDDWLEEVGGFEREGLQVEVPDEVFEDAELCHGCRVSKGSLRACESGQGGFTYMPHER